MNNKRHVHHLEIKHRYGSDSGRMIVKYGDQSELWPTYGPWLDRRRKRKVRLIVSKHDSESIKAGQAIDDYISQQNQYQNLVENIADKSWSHKWKVESRPPKPIRPDIVITLTAEEACRLKLALVNIRSQSKWSYFYTSDSRRVVEPDPNKSYAVKTELSNQLEQEGIYF